MHLRRSGSQLNVRFSGEDLNFRDSVQQIWSHIAAKADRFGIELASPEFTGSMNLTTESTVDSNVYNEQFATKNA